MGRSNFNSDEGDSGSANRDKFRVLDMILNEIEYTAVQLKKIQTQLNESSLHKQQLWEDEFRKIMAISSLHRKYVRELSKFKDVIPTKKYERMQNYVDSVIKSTVVEID